MTAPTTKQKCLDLSRKVSEAALLPEQASRVSTLQDLKREALDCGCETVALAALFHLVGEFLETDQASLTTTQAEIEALMAKPEVKAALENARSEEPEQ